MRSNFGYNPMGSQGVGGQYGTQQGNLGRYRPPTMNGNGGWNDSGGYAYNLPNAYGSTGLGYMSGLGNMFSPWQGNMNPQMNYGGGSSFQDMLQGLYGSLNGRNRGLDQYGGMMDPTQSIGRDNRVGGSGSIPRFGLYPEGPSMGIAPNPQIAPGTGGSTGGNSRPGGGMGMGTVAPSPVGGVTNQPAPAQGMGANRFWWGGNGG